MTATPDLRERLTRRGLRNPYHSRIKIALAGVLSVLLAGCATARATPAATTSGSGPAAAGKGGLQPYTKVVQGTRADSGLITLHRGDDKLLFEIPDSLFGRDLLLVSRIASVPANLGGYIPAGYKAQEQVLRMERRGEKVLLRKISYEQVAADSLPIATSVVSNNFAPIVASFAVRARGPEGESVVIDATDFFEKDVPAISGLDAEQRTRYGVKKLDEERSFIEYARAYPLNVEVRHTMTFDATKPPSNANTGTLSMEMHQSMVLLPEEPMRPRYADPRVGFFSVEQVNFGLNEQKAARQRFIRRWRLEPADSAAYVRGELVEPKKPIVYYLDPATPAEWRPCVRQGIEDWQKPFETAGFRNAIVARDAPSATEDPEWSGEDVQNSVVRWAASETRNAQGPSVSDPRSGEIIESDIVWYHNHLRSYRNRLMLETGAANPLARSLPVDSDLMCEAMRAVIAHEVGHAIGLPHNMGASSAYPVDSLRSAAFVRRMGIAPTIMDYARQNYIAQPGDGLVGADFIRQIGPADHYVINWGYRSLPEALTAEAERPILHRWILEKADDPIYRYGPQRGGLLVDPSSQTEDLGDDPVRASSYGIANLRRVTPELVQWTTREGEGYEDLAELYGELVSQWSRYVGHTLPLVGGVYETRKTADQPGPVYMPVPRSRQEDAVRFLEREVFDAPTWLTDPQILRQIEPAGGVDRLGDRQTAVLRLLLSPERLQRLAEIETQYPAAAYPLADFMGDVKDAVWGNAGELRDIDTYRRQLQRAYIDRLASLLTEEPDLPPDSPYLWRTEVDATRSDLRPLARAQLRAIEQEARRAAPRAADRMTRIHLEDVAARIEEVLDERER